jgi:bifunctional non-homologous end joining protein LigD
VHKHDATRLHYDLRLEIDGALASWSVPKGPSYDPAVRRLAVQTEDHPLEYGAFEGRIPDGEYGAGDSLLWDRGTWDTVPPGQGSAMRRKGHVHFRLEGEKLRGEWHLIRTTGPRGERRAMGEDAAQGTKSQWLLFKAKDGKEDPRYDVVEARPESVVSGRVTTRGPERKGKLRAPRPSPARPPAAAAPAAVAPAAESIALTHPERVLYPRDGIAKQDLADYYAKAAGPLLRALSGRPLVLVHWNEGIDRPSWFHQDMGGGERGRAEPWMHLVATPSVGRGGKAGKLVRHLIADSPAALRWLAQRSALELHCWHSREGSLGSPDWVVFDLDPAEGRGIEQAIPVAQVLQGMFEQLRLVSFPKTTGKRGLHLLVPLAPGHTYEDAQTFALRVAQTVAQQMPEVTLERSRARRGGRLYLDCLQNGQGKTIVAPYSPRGVDGAPVSAPLRWSEVRPGLDPRVFNLRTMPARLEQVGDLFAPALENGVRLPRFR